MGAISLQNVGKEFAGRPILEAVTLELQSGRIVGLVGPNGAGKTTIFKLILGELAADGGRIARSRDLTLGYLSQHPAVGLDNTVHDEVLSSFDELLRLEQRMHDVAERLAAAHGAQQAALMKEYDKLTERFTTAGGYEYEQRIGEILGGLGFVEADWKLPMRALSGGQKCRVALAKMLLQDSTYLLLDEPTNHLDIDAVRWLERFLKSHSGGVALISHDRYLLDRLCDDIVAVERCRVASYPGNYSNFIAVRERNELTQARQAEKDAAFVEKELEFIRRFQAGQRSKEARGRRTRLERRKAEGEFVLDGPAQRRSIAFDFKIASQPNATVFAVDDLAMGYDGKPLFAGLTLRVGVGERLGITGPNGTGKTTLLRILTGRLAPTAGTVHVDPKAQLGYFSQEADEINPAQTVLNAVLETRPDFTELRTRTLLGAFGFEGDTVFANLGRLSGGERARVRLVKLLLSSPNVLVLDEPTNHLDIPSREALESALDDYPGTIVAVSHDRYFLDRMVDRLLVIRPEGQRLTQGGYSEYVELIEAEQAEAARRAEAARAGEASRRSSAARNDRRPKSDPRPGPTGPASRFDKMKLPELEAWIANSEAELRGLDVQFGDAQVYQDAARVRELRTRYDLLKGELAQAEEAWLQRSV